MAAKKKAKSGSGKKLRAQVKKLESQVERAKAKATRWKKTAKRQEATSTSSEARIAKLERKLAESRRTSTPTPTPEPISPAVTSLPATASPARGSTPDDGWTVTALRAEARSRGLSGYSRMSKAQLLAALK